MTDVEQDAARVNLSVGQSLVAVLAPVLLVLVWCLRHEPVGRNGSHEGRLYLALFALVLLGVTAVIAGPGLGLAFPRRLFHPRGAQNLVKAVLGRLLVGVWASAATFGAFNYYQFDEEVISTPGDYADATYYYLNSKYFGELGYYRLYHAMLVADDEGAKRFAKVRRYRDLVTYDAYFPRSQAVNEAEAVKQHFSAEAWEAFKHDVDWITAQNPQEGWDYFFIDHGYNPPPSWTLVGGTFARLCPVEHIKWVTMIDFVLVVLMMGAIGWAFGGWALLVAMLWFLVTFSGRWPILGQSLLRFDWLTALVIGMCLLKRGLTGGAGGLLTYAALNRVFPAVFGFPYVVTAVRDAVERRRNGPPLLAPAHRRFGMGVVVSLAVFGLGAALVEGPQAYVDAARNLGMHGSPASYSSHRVGLGDALVFRFETSNRDIGASGGMQKKTEQLWAMQGPLQGLGLLSAVAIALFVWRRRDPPWMTMWLGLYPVFIMTTPQINYFNMRLLPLLFHVALLVGPASAWAGREDQGPGDHEGSDLRGRWHLWPLLWLFGIEAVTQWSMVERMPRYTVTSLTSVGLCVYLAFMAWALGRAALPKKKPPTPEGDET